MSSELSSVRSRRVPSVRRCVRTVWVRGWHIVIVGVRQFVVCIRGVSCVEIVIVCRGLYRL